MCNLSVTEENHILYSIIFGKYKQPLAQSTLTCQMIYLHTLASYLSSMQDTSVGAVVNSYHQVTPHSPSVCIIGTAVHW